MKNGTGKWDVRKSFEKNCPGRIYHIYIYNINARIIYIHLTVCR